ncbi:MAG: Rrf2 family transcriptional regulator [Clostridia bacterium]|nr:Rrf2 family transcriptional regulator [Clostridia bacterium]
MTSASETAAESACCNPVIIRNIFSKLKNAGLLNTKSGNGKTELDRSAEEINLWAIYTAVESGETNEIFKFHQNTSATCPLGSNIHELLTPYLDDAVNALKASLFAVTLQTLIDELYKKIK